jgi:hypothetical protein
MRLEALKYLYNMQPGLPVAGCVVREVLENDLPTLTRAVNRLLERGEAEQNQTGDL